MNAAAMQQVIYLLGLTLMFCLLSVTVAQEEQNTMQTYIVWVEKPASSRLLAESNQDLESWYQSFLPETTTANSNQLRSSRMVHAYRNVATGFAAKLTPEEVKEMEKKDGFVSAQAERILQLQTTHSPDFLNLHQGFGLWKQANYGEGVIIGVLDSGIGANHPSFSDEGVPPPPVRWKGKCEFNGTLCNNKLIGAKNFLGAGKGNATAAPPIDNNGHGTHTSSTAAGNFVAGASVFGEANGTAVGMAPYAHLAMYQVCTAGGGCADGDILAALDAAVDDGVDVLSLSLGSESLPFYQDVIAIGAYAAIQKGIFFSCAAGNDGPVYNSLSNEAPWILTVGASTTDRILKSQNEAGDDKTNTSSSSTIIATILFNGTVIGDGLAPKVASFSSRGPSTASPGILKPDIIGPGVSILAAWPVSVDGTQSKATFNIISGTSMATPHISGIAALLKKSHPDWSPAAVKSAIMTTADVLNLAGTPIVDQSLNPADVFAIGAGHVNPSRANDPGLIYDTQLKDYIPYLCGLNYTDKQIQIIAQQTVNCSAIEAIPEAQLNYPSFSIRIRSYESKSQYYTRTVKNVGPASSTYNLDLFVPHKMGMSVNPQVLTFTQVNQELSFHVEFTAEDGAGKDGVPISQGYLRWFSDKYNVTSPIAVVFE